MNGRIAAVGVVVLLALGVAAWVFMPASTDVGGVQAPKPGSGPAPAPEYEVTKAQPKPEPPVVAAGTPAPVVQDPDGVPVVELLDQPGSITDPLGSRPINKQGLEAAVQEMLVDLQECHDIFKKAAPDLPDTLELQFDFEERMPPKEYGEYEEPMNMMIASTVSGEDAAKIPSGPDREAFEACMLRSLDDILYDRHPGGARSRARMTASFTAQDGAGE